jgi:ADP-heptose:LPS heptosyltransferase
MRLSPLVLKKVFFWMRPQPTSNLILSGAKKILVVRLDENGDAIMTSAFLRELRKNAPLAQITLVVRPDVYNYFELCPYVNQVFSYHEELIYDAGKLSIPAQISRQIRACHFARQYLRGGRFDLGINPRWDVDYYNASYLLYFSGCRKRVAYSSEVDPHKRKLNRGFDSLYTDVSSRSKLEHEVLRNLELLSVLGGRFDDTALESWHSEDDLEVVRCLLKEHGVEEGEALIALGLGGREEKKCWPLVHFKVLGEMLSRAFPLKILLLGGRLESRSDALYTELFPGAINLIGKTSWRQTAALLERTTAYVGNNTAALHVAAAVGTFVVDISCHPRSADESYYLSPKRFGPWCKAHKVFQPENPLPPCRYGCTEKTAHCITQIPPEAVFEFLASDVLSGFSTN